MCGLHVPVGSGSSTAAGVEARSVSSVGSDPAVVWGSDRAHPLAPASEREFQNGSHQHQQEQGKIKLQKWLLPAPFFLERAPTDSCLTGRYFEVSESSSPLVYMLSNCCFFSGFQGK